MAVQTRHSGKTPSKANNKADETEQYEQAVGAVSTPAPKRQAPSLKAAVNNDKKVDDKVVLLKDQNDTEKWKKWHTRVLFSFMMGGAFTTLVFLGHVPITIMLLAFEIFAFKELINISYKMTYENQLPYHRTLNWYFVFVTQCFLYVETILRHEQFQPAREYTVLEWFKRYHNFICYCLYMIGVLGFVLTLKKGMYKYQFKQFAWTHLAIVIVFAQSSLYIENIFSGIYWLVFPATLVIGNDCGAYIFGFFYGRTPLIALSPKKTWEGFIGGAAVTMFLGVTLSWIYAQFYYFICPKRDIVLFQLPTYETFTSFPECEVPAPFVSHEYDMPAMILAVGNAVLTPVTAIVSASGILGGAAADFLSMPEKISLMPVQLHGIVFGAFASIVAPFGGFFASGFKRAYNIKDFGDVIPGHGGILDRFDCHLLMGTFTYIYLANILDMHNLDPAEILQHISKLTPDDQRVVFDQLKGMLAIGN